MKNKNRIITIAPEPDQSQEEYIKSVRVMTGIKGIYTVSDNHTITIEVDEDLDMKAVAELRKKIESLYKGIKPAGEISAMMVKKEEDE